MSDLDLFGRRSGSDAGGAGGASPALATEGGTPLAARMRPRTLEEFRGQEHLLGEGRPWAVMIEQGLPTSAILWGPPGSGKTTLARLVADRCDATFEPFSAVTEGIARVRQVVAQARERRATVGRRTILFCDEIHRFNKAQQDAFLPHVEDGTVILIGATTENPSFEIVRPLLSRAPVYVLEPLGEDSLVAILSDALTSERGLAPSGVVATDDALVLLARGADGDARRALGALEGAAALVGPGGAVDVDIARDALQHRYGVYDKSGDEHFNLISALQKSVRGSDPDGALYWLARMLDAGEDPLYVARRLVRMASEDVGLADPSALSVTVAARDAYLFLGSPEGELALAEAAVYLASAEKSNRLHQAWDQASREARETPGEAVPMHLRNAPTTLMGDLGYGRDYLYDPAHEGGVAPQTYLPLRLQGRRFYDPGERGYEAAVSERLERWAELRGRQRAGSGGPDSGPEER